MSFSLSAYAAWADKGDLAHYTSMSRVPPDCREKAEYFPNRTDFCPQEAEGGAGTCLAVQAHTVPPPPGWCACISDKALASCLSPKAVKKE